jgi:hypothetical protein
MVADRENHLIWRSQDLNNERSWGGRLCTNHVPGGVVIKLDERSCRYNEDIREHAAVRSMHREDMIIEKK